MSLSSIVNRLLGATSNPAIEHDAFQDACRSKQCHVVDVREAHEYAAGHVPGALNHPLSRFNPADLPTDKPVVLICQAGSRSARALQQAHAAGRSDVVHYAGGTSGWQARGGKVARPT